MIVLCFAFFMLGGEGNSYLGSVVICSSSFDSRSTSDWRICFSLMARF